MEKRTIILGALLILTGFVFFSVTGFAKYTALIPLPFGIIFVLLGWLAYAEKRRKIIMHAASLLSLLGALPLFMSAPKIIAMLQGETILRPLAAVEQSVMGGLCLVYFILCVKYFIDRQIEKKRIS